MNKQLIAAFLIVIFFGFVLGPAVRALAAPFSIWQNPFGIFTLEHWFPSLYMGQKIFNIEMTLLGEYKKGNIEINFTRVAKGVQVTFTSDKPELLKPIHDNAAEIESVLKNLK